MDAAIRLGMQVVAQARVAQPVPQPSVGHRRGSAHEQCAHAGVWAGMRVRYDDTDPSLNPSTVAKSPVGGGGGGGVGGGGGGVGVHFERLGVTQEVGLSDDE